MNVNEEKFIGYNSWCIDTLNIDIAQALTYQDLENDERGVYVDTEVQPQEVLVRIPFQSLLTIERLETSFPELFTYVQENPEIQLREDDLLTLLFIYEKHYQQQNSKWHRHFFVLPKEFVNVLYFQQKHIDHLKGTNAYVIAQRWQQQVHSDYEELHDFWNNFCESSDISHDIRSLLTYERYKWGLSIIFSRCVSVQCTETMYKAMAPVFDMFNHSPKAEMTHGYDPSTDSFCLQSHQRWNAGSEVYINYGPLPNQKLVLMYGFILDSNPHTNVELWCPMSPHTPDYAIKNQLLHGQNIAHESEPFQLTMSDALPAKLLLCLRIQHLSEAELAISHRAFDNERLSYRNEHEILCALIDAFEMMLSHYPKAENGQEVEEEEDYISRIVKDLSLSEQQILKHNLALAQDMLMRVEEEEQHSLNQAALAQD